MVYPIDTHLTYRCLPGYEMEGFPDAQCTIFQAEVKWFGPDFKCKVDLALFAAKTCDPPGDILNGIRKGGCFDYGCKVEYECQDGFEIEGESRFRHCQADGTWSPREPPVCSRESLGFNWGLDILREER
ncbi:unnamed protein product, partial [Darwinula stevensoni]